MPVWHTWAFSFNRVTQTSLFTVNLWYKSTRCVFLTIYHITVTHQTQQPFGYWLSVLDLNVNLFAYSIYKWFHPSQTLNSVWNIHKQILTLTLASSAFEIVKSFSLMTAHQEGLCSDMNRVQPDTYPHTLAPLNPTVRFPGRWVWHFLLFHSLHCRSVNILSYRRCQLLNN